MHATAGALNNAWRNNFSHAQGKLVLMTSEFSRDIAEEIMVASRSFMRRLATEMPPGGSINLSSEIRHSPDKAALLCDLCGMTITTCGGERLFWRRLTPSVGVVPRFVAGEHSPAHQALAQAHWVRRQIAVRREHDEWLANLVVANPFATISTAVFGHIEEPPFEPARFCLQLAGVECLVSTLAK
jgi:hypothetical protein